MRILLYSRAFPPSIGGMERFAEDLASWMAARGHFVTVMTRTSAPSRSDRGKPYRILRGGGPLATAGAFAGIDAVHINGLSLKGIARSSIAGQRPVVTHAGYQAICPAGLAWSARGLCNVRMGGADRCSVCPRAGVAGRANVRLHRLGAAVAAANVCVSDYLAKRTNLPRSVMIYNPISKVAFESELDGDRRDLVLFAGRLVTEKGLDLLLHAMVLVPDVRIRIAGEGPMRSTWERLAGEIGLAGRVRFLGAKSFTELVEHYRDAAVVCVPTLSPESFGYTAAEAMAMGRAVVATPSGALPELLADGRGFVAAAATPKALAAALREALENGGRRKRAEKRARDFALSNLSVDCVGPQYEALYESAAS